MRPDEAEFEQLVEPHRRELHAHCYRMLGSLHDTEEAMQEAMLRIWRGLDRFEGRSSLRSWLYRIATNTCFDTIGRRKRRMLPEEILEVEDGYASPDASYEEREAVELAFVAAMQHLPPRHRQRPTRGRYLHLDGAGENARSVLPRRAHPGGREDQGSDRFRRQAGGHRGWLFSWPDRAADPSRVEAVFRRFGLPDHVD